MCDPVSIMAITMLGTIASASAAKAQGDAQGNAYDYEAQMQKRNAAIAGKQAEDASHRGFVEETALRRKAAAVKGEQRAGMSAAGMDANAGTPLDILAETAYFSEWDAATTRYNAAQEKQGFLNQQADFLGKSELSSLSARNARAAGKQQAIATLISGTGKVAGQWYDYNKK